MNGALTFGRWTTTGVPVKGKYSCVCQCGSLRDVIIHDLKSGRSQSCGCLRRERASQACRTHGMSRTRAYWAWSSMHSRCSNPSVANFKNYGARGIRVCRRWRSFINFYRDMGERPTGLSLERRNNNGLYSPSNCVWASRSAQRRNSRTIRAITINGVTRCAMEWAQMYSIHYRCFIGRLRMGWNPLAALTTPSNRKAKP